MNDSYTDVLDDYFRTQQDKGEQKWRGGEQDKRGGEEGGRVQLPEISMKNLFSKEAMLRVGPHRREKGKLQQQKEKDRQFSQKKLEDAQLDKEEQAGRLSQLDLQIMRMNQVVQPESKQEMMLFTVNNSLQDKYISRHLKADLGSLGEFMKVNEVQAVREETLASQEKSSQAGKEEKVANTIANNAIKQQKNLEEIEQEQARIQAIQANPLNILATDKDHRNKNDAAEFLIHQILTKTFGQSDVSALKNRTLESLNFDRSTQQRLKEVQADPLLHGLYNLNRRNANINDFLDHKIDLLLDQALPFRRQMQDLSSQAHRQLSEKKKPISKKTSIVQQGKNLLSASSLLQQASARETCDLLWTDRPALDCSLVEELLQGQPPLEKAWQHYLLNREEADHTALALLHSVNQKPKKARQNTLLDTKDRDDSEDTLPNIEDKQVLITNTQKLALKNITLSSDTLFALLTKYSALDSLEELELTNVSTELSGVMQKVQTVESGSSPMAPKQMTTPLLLPFLLMLLLHQGQGRLQQVTLNNVALPDEAWDTLQSLLQTNRVLALTLSHLHLGDRRLILLARPLISHNVLQHLDVSFNTLSRSTLQTFALIMKYLGSLKLLNVHGNPLTKEKKALPVYRKELQIIV